jgi:hypothetical protein
MNRVPHEIAPPPRTRTPVRIEVWLCAALLVLCVISYPTALLLALAPAAGWAAFLAAGLFLLALATLGQAGHRLFDRSAVPLLASLSAAMVVGLIAVILDRLDPYTATLCAAIVAGQIIFTWHFLPWLVADAGAVEFVPGALLQLFRRLSRQPRRPRAALPFTLLLGLLTLGLGASWARAQPWAPHPAPWLIALILLSFALMFLERVSLFDHSASHGNLHIDPGSYSYWTGAAAIALLLFAGLAALGPWRPPAERLGPPSAGQLFSPTPAGPSPLGLPDAPSRADAVRRELLRLLLGTPRTTVALILFLLLLLVVLILVWGFARSRPASWLAAAAAWIIARLLRAWRRLAAALQRWFARPAQQPAPAAPSEDEELPDPLFDLFDSPELLAKLAPHEVVIRTYHLLLNFAEMLGHGRRPGQTPFEYARGLVAARPGAREAVMTLTWGYAGAMYGGDEADLPRPETVRDSWRRLAEALTAHLDPDEVALRRRSYLAARKLEAGP